MDKPLVRLRWRDASDGQSSSSWYSDQEIDAFGEADCEVVSVGWLKSETKLFLTLCGDYSDNEDGSVTWGRPTKVPIGMLIKKELLQPIAEDPPT